MLLAASVVAPGPGRKSTSAIDMFQLRTVTCGAPLEFGNKDTVRSCTQTRSGDTGSWWTTVRTSTDATAALLIAAAATRDLSLPKRVAVTVCGMVLLLL